MSNENDGADDPLSQSLEMLSHRYRRRVLLAVAQHEPQTADDIASDAIEAASEADDRTLERVKVELHHEHLPRLADAGFIDWDQESGTITRGARFEEIEPLLELMDDHRDELPDDWL